MSQSPAASPEKVPWGLVILLGSMTAFGPMAIDMYLPSLPTIGASLNATAGQTQATMGAFLAGMAIGQFFYGPASDRIGRKAPVLLGAGVFALASVICANATSIEMLLGARFLQALGACSGAVVARAIVRDLYNHTETARMLSLLTLVMGLAPILAPLLGGFLMTIGGWQANFWAQMVFGLAVGAATLFQLKESRSEATAVQARSENPLQAYGALIRQRRLVGYTLAGALNGAALFTYVSSSPELLIKTYGISPQMFGWVFGLNAVGIIGGGQVNRYVLRTYTPDQVLRAASLCAAVVAFVLVLAATTGIGGAWTVMPLLFLLLSSFGFMQGNTMAGALNVDPLRAGSISALMGGVSFASGALASTAVGIFHDGTARPMAMTILIAVLGSALTLRMLALPRR
ncbi:MAG: Bcr/CflA family drug resistance efflux transporter [Alphaproteobacteria bacterium PA2]|nr:MAG: Bcr/CflA family drug resistance efflux transporter [Alphaproteobacteria bacterium PA2]